LDEMSNRLFQGGTSPCLMISNSNQLLIGTPKPFSTALQQALAQGYGAQCAHTVTDIPPVAPGLEHLHPSTVYLVTNAFLVADTEYPARRWHRHIRELLKDLNLSRRYGFRLFYPSSMAVFGPTSPAENCLTDMLRDKF